MKGITEQAGRDCKAYELAREHMLEFPGVTDKVLQRYLSAASRRRSRTMAEVFLRLLLSLRNKGMMATVIPAEFVHSLGRVLNSFDPVTVTQRFASADDLLDTIVKKLVLLQGLGSRARIRWVDLVTRPIRTPCGSAASARPRRPSPSIAPVPCGAHA